MSEILKGSGSFRHDAQQTMHFGDMEVRYLDGGEFRLDGGAMFGVVPKVLWEKRSAPDDKNRIRMRANSLLVRAAGKTIVIETGNGTKWDAKQRARIYAHSRWRPASSNRWLVKV